jgi:hypothetical protein
MGFAMNETPAAEFVALVTGIGAVLIWTTLLFLTVRHHKRGAALSMALVGTLASFGACASALAFAGQLSEALRVSPQALTFVASMGRGALIMGGLIVLSRLHR